MSCCGSSRTPEADRNSAEAPLSPYPVNVQPVAHPNPYFPQSTIPSPPPATLNDHRTPPPPQSYGSHSPPPQQQFQSSSYNLAAPAPAFNEPLLRPNATYATSSPAFLPQQYGPHSVTTAAAPGQSFAPPLTDEGKMSVSIDFGTTFSGVAYGSSRIAAGKVQQILHWPGSLETFRKVPTCLLYDEQGQVMAWGLEAKNASPMPNCTKCEWFKLFLEPHALRDESAVDPRLPRLPPGKRPLDVIVDFLYCLWEYAKEQITREIGAVADLDSADVWLTVPAAWDAKGCDLMREAAINAGLVHSSRAGDHAWRERLRIITEPEAAAVHCAHLTDLHKLKPSQTFMICDAGGGTVDLAVYKIIGQMANLEIAEMSARSGANCGSLFLDLRFRELVRTLLAEHPAHLDAASLAYFMHSFSETDKLAYMGESDDENMFNFTCFNVEDPDDASVGLINGELSIPGNLLRREVFDPVVNQVLELIEGQMAKIDQRIDALLLVGGFSGSEYLYKRVEEQFGARIKVIARPSDADTATARGAAQYGLARRPLVSSVVAPRSYIMKVKLPAEQEDLMKRPAYITTNNAGVPICENRLQYLVAKGAILRKGQKMRTKFCKFSQSSQDRIFVATLYTSESDKIMRYTDEGETMELCKWTVDLGTLPSFQENASMPTANGFYTDFELGLELDSAEVRGVLLNEGQEWGRVVFDFLA
ncbi:actin-like ATPase domain-containing protein [Dentipellis sp. KUC8613]|nr:actin-like ATPase domain-containing protein [Dentipellis sp. KUC8613]